MYNNPISGNNSNKNKVYFVWRNALMGNFNKKYIIREAENIIANCNKKSFNKTNDKNKIINLKIQNKKQKRKILFWRIITLILLFVLLVAMFN